MSRPTKYTKKEIDETFKKMGLSQKEATKDSLEDWMKKTKQDESQKDVWVVSNTTTSFTNFN